MKNTSKKGRWVKRKKERKKKNVKSVRDETKHECLMTLIREAKERDEFMKKEQHRRKKMEGRNSAGLSGRHRA